MQVSVCCVVQGSTIKLTIFPPGLSVLANTPTEQRSSVAVQQFSTFLQTHKQHIQKKIQKGSLVCEGCEKVITLKIFAENDGYVFSFPIGQLNNLLLGVARVVAARRSTRPTRHMWRNQKAV